MDGNGCVSACLYNAILVRRLWTVEKLSEEHPPSFLAVAHYDIAQERDK